MKKIKLLLFLLFFISACTKEEIVYVPATTADGTYFNLKVNGTNILLKNSYDKATLTPNKGNIVLFVDYGNGSNSPGYNKLYVVFDTSGKFIEAYQESMDISDSNYYIKYKNYRNFPANYFNINIVSFNESEKRLKFSIAGKLYADDANLESEFINLEGDFNMKYEGGMATIPPTFQFGGFDQHCTAKLSGTAWTALRELSQGEFTAEDPYKIEIKFPLAAGIGIYNLSPSGSSNYLRFAKFNTTTKVFDYYDVTGVVNQTYREFHGGGIYTFFGTFSFTASNPNNPSDVIQVTDGDFASYLHYN